MRRRCAEPPEWEPARKRRPEDSETDGSFVLEEDEALPPGLLMTDIAKRQWRIGKPVGRGSFGRIYLASDSVREEVNKYNARYVVKIEPHSNGPLFVEIHALIRRAQAKDVKEWRLKHKQKSLGMPIYIASGSFVDEKTDTKYRFLVLPRYEVDLEKIIRRRGGTLDAKNVLVLAVQILDVLEYLHDAGYTHSDIKSSNLMLGFDGMKFGKVPIVGPSFFKQVRKNALKKQKTTGYYNDEDFVMREEKIKEKRMVCMRKRMKKMLSDKASRNLHRHAAFNLRQLSNQINYEDFNSSVCSDISYQRLLDEQEIKIEKKPDCEDKDTFSEAILSQSNGQIYLLDYGLASKFLEKNGAHKELEMDSRKAHDGTLEYSSRDSHIGAHSRRSDLETLAYNLLDWLTGSLPWKTSEMLAEPDLVHALKKNYMNDVGMLMKTCFKSESYPEFLEKYLQYVGGLDFAEKPDYEYCRGIFREEFARCGFGNEKEMRLALNEPPRSPVKKILSFSKRLGRSPIKNTSADFASVNGIRKPYGRENMQSLENELKLELLRKALNTSSDGVRKPCASRNFFVSDSDLVTRLKQSLLPLESFGKKLSPKNLRSKKRTMQKKRGKKSKRNSIGKFGNFLGSGKQYSWAEILAGNPEDIVKRMNKKVSSDEDDSSVIKYRHRKTSNASESSFTEVTHSALSQKDYLKGLNPTYAMKEIHANFRKKTSKRPGKETEAIVCPEGYTPAMVKVLQAREKREAKERAQAAKEKQARKQAENATSAQAVKERPVRKQADKERQARKQAENLTSASTQAKRQAKQKERKKKASEPQTPKPRQSKVSKEPVYPTPIRRVLESKRKPIVKITKVSKKLEEKLNSPKKVQQPKSSATTSKTPAPASKPRRTARLNNQRVTRSAFKHM